MSLSTLDLEKVLFADNEILTLPVSILHQQHSIPISGLAETRANGVLFLNTKRVIEIAKTFGIPTHCLPRNRTCEVRGYDGRRGEPITHMILIDLNISGKRHERMPMLIADLGERDLIIGRQWFAHYRALVDCEHRCLIWPHERGSPRDPARENIKKMTQAIQGIFEEHPPALPIRSREKGPPPPMMLSTEIAMIGAIRLDRHARKEENKVFITSFYEIDKIPQDRQLTNTLSIGNTPLYKQTTEQLEATKKSISENLIKGFIVPSTAPFASPIKVSYSYLRALLDRRSESRRYSK